MRIKLFIFYLFVSIGSWAQSNQSIDSLLGMIKATTIDSTKAELIFQLGKKYHFTDKKSQLRAHLKAEKIFQKLLVFRPNEAWNLVEIADCYIESGNINLADKYYLNALKKVKKAKLLKLEFDITDQYFDQFNKYIPSVNFLERIYDLKQRAIQENNDSLLFKAYDLINDQYLLLGTKRELRKNYADSMLAIAKQIKNNDMLRIAYFNLAVSSEGRVAIAYYIVSLKYINRKIDKKYLSSVYNNLSGKYRVIGELDSSIIYADSAYIVSKEIGRMEGMAAAQYRKAEAYYMLNRFVDAIESGKKALQIFKNEDILRRQNSCVLVISASYKELGNFKQALHYFEMSIRLRDSLEVKSQVREAEFVDRKFKYELDKKRDSTAFAHERILNGLAIENLNNKLSKERMQRYLLYSGISMILIIAIILFIGFHRIRRDKLIIELQKILVEEKNQEILDSIKYAKRIQNAILPQEKVVKEYLKDSFIFYRPKDIVAGDFYWMELKEGMVLFAVADCTGHGVPGAMVSVVCNNALNRSVREHGITDPGKILDKTREIIVQEFEKSKDDVQDGMDIAICTLKDNKLQYAGANNPLWVIRKNEIIETKANKQPIGKFNNPEIYVTHYFEVQNGDCIYIFTDGFVDQFGGENGKKFRVKAFRDLLLKTSSKPMFEQQLLIKEAFEKWKGNLEQIDDVTVLGIRI